MGRINLPAGFKCKTKNRIHDMPVGSEVFIVRGLGYYTFGGYEYEINFVGESEDIKRLNSHGPFAKVTDLDLDLKTLEVLFGR